MKPSTLETPGREPLHLPPNPERRQAEYDIVTQFSEIVDGSMLTSFELNFDGRELYGPDGRGMYEVIQSALEHAEDMAQTSPGLSFELRRRRLEKEEYQLALDMARGKGPNTMIVISDFPPELYGASEDVGGYNVTRRQTMLRILARQPNGNIKMTSQSLDGSDPRALEAIYDYFDISSEPGEKLGQRIHQNLSANEQDDIVDVLRQAYDQSLRDQYGGEWHAGRRPADYRNTYDFVCGQWDIVRSCVGLQLEGRLTQQAMYDHAALMQKRFREQKDSKVISLIPHFQTVNNAALAEEARLAGLEAAQGGEVFSACGVTIQAEGDESTESLLGSAGYGSKAESGGRDRYGSLKFKCPNGHVNERPRNKLIDNCKVCGTSVKC